MKDIEKSVEILIQEVCEKFNVDMKNLDIIQRLYVGKLIEEFLDSLKEDEK